MTIYPPLWSPNKDKYVPTKDCSYFREYPYQWIYLEVGDEWEYGDCYAGENNFGLNVKPGYPYEIGPGDNPNGGYPFWIGISGTSIQPGTKVTRDVMCYLPRISVNTEAKEAWVAKERQRLEENGDININGLYLNTCVTLEQAKACAKLMGCTP